MLTWRAICLMLKELSGTYQGFYLCCISFISKMRLLCLPYSWVRRGLTCSTALQKQKLLPQCKHCHCVMVSPYFCFCLTDSDCIARNESSWSSFHSSDLAGPLCCHNQHYILLHNYQHKILTPINFKL